MPRPAVSYVTRLFVAAAALAAPLPAAAVPTAPPNLESCYMLALEKDTPEMAYLAKEICRAVYAPVARELVIANPADGACREIWLDARGRYQDSERYCVLESTSYRKWTFACQNRRDAAAYTLVDLEETEGGYMRTGAVIGYDPGQLYTSLAACLRARAKR